MDGEVEARLARTLESGEVGGVPILPGKRELIDALRGNVASLIQVEVDQLVLVAGICEAYSCLDSQAAGDIPKPPVTVRRCCSANA